MKNLRLILISIGLLFLHGINNITVAQPKFNLDIPGSSVNSFSHSLIFDPIFCIQKEDEKSNNPPFTRLDGSIYWGVKTIVDGGVMPCKIRAQGTANIVVWGNDSSYMKVQWRCHSNTKYTCYDPNCLWFAIDTSALSATVKVVIGGAPAGTPVTVSYKWKHNSACASVSEANNEDTAEVDDTYLNIFGREGFNTNGLNVASGFKYFSRRTGRDTVTSFNAVAGDTLTIVAAAFTQAYIFPPPITPQNPRKDLASSEFFGSAEIVVTVPGGIPVFPGISCDSSNLVYSVDIGSDAERSDPSPDGNELLDPGDLYVQGNSPVPYLNDSTIFNADPPPNAATAAGTCFPGPQQALQHVLNFDLDGADKIDFNFSANLNLFGLGKLSIPPFNSPCIYTPEFALISYDDDRGIPFWSAANCNVPSSFDPYDTLYTHGTPAEKDEVVYVEFTNASPGSAYYMGVIAPYMEETDVSSLLSPSPTNFSDMAHNDDVDALDRVSQNPACGYQYFSVDHEAHFYYAGDTLQAGAIYQIISPGVIQPVITPPLHLGLPNGVDIDAFEFAWVYDSLQGRNGLALVFSVSAPDPFSAVDYSAGLNPSALYASFMDGSFFELSEFTNAEDVDAITFLCGPLTPQGVTQVPPTIFPPLGTGNIYNDELKMQVFPNPANDAFTVKVKGEHNGTYMAKLADMKGRVVWADGISLSGGVNQFKVSTSNVAPGVYLLDVVRLNAVASKPFRARVVIIR